MTATSSLGRFVDAAGRSPFVVVVSVDGDFASAGFVEVRP
jgi:hypothetical protein